MRHHTNSEFFEKDYITRYGNLKLFFWDKLTTKQRNIVLKHVELIKDEHMYIFFNHTGKHSCAGFASFNVNAIIDIPSDNDTLTICGNGINMDMHKIDNDTQFELFLYHELCHLKHYLNDKAMYMEVLMNSVAFPNFKEYVTCYLERCAWLATERFYRKNFNKKYHWYEFTNDRRSINILNKKFVKV